MSKDDVVAMLRSLLLSQGISTHSVAKSMMRAAHDLLCVGDDRSDKDVLLDLMRAAIDTAITRHAGLETVIVTFVWPDAETDPAALGVSAAGPMTVPKLLRAVGAVQDTNRGLLEQLWATCVPAEDPVQQDSKSEPAAQP